MTIVSRVLALGVVCAILAGCGSAAPRGDGGGSVRVISPYGALTRAEGSARSYGPHIGIDIAAPVGTRVIAAADAVVWSIGNDGPCGMVIVLTHGTIAGEEIATRYCHLSAVRVEIQQRVRRGDVIGISGITGLRPAPGFESVHFELRRNWDAVDPTPYLVGCFDRGRTYSTSQLALSYPIAC